MSFPCRGLTSVLSLVLVGRPERQLWLLFTFSAQLSICGQTQRRQALGMRTWAPALWHLSRGVGRPDCLHLCLPVAWYTNYGERLGSGSARSNQVPVLARMGSSYGKCRSFQGGCQQTPWKVQPACAGRSGALKCSASFH